MICSEKCLCPHCKNKSISVWAKLKVGPLNKIVCPVCREKSAVYTFHGFVVIFIFSVIFWSFLFVSVIINFIWLMILIIPVAFFLERKYLYSVKLRPVKSKR